MIFHNYFVHWDNRKAKISYLWINIGYVFNFFGETILFLGMNSNLLHQTKI